MRDAMIASEPTLLQAAPELRQRVRPGNAASRVKEWSLRHPVIVLALISLAAVTINCYPVIFCGRSFVSPACVPSLVYDRWPPMPGMEPATAPVPDHGSDVYAAMWWGVPLGFLESRSLFEHGELPLWSRYSHAGEPLIGQGVSMLGDPLQLIVIAGRGSAWAWDLKFLAAKLLFCLGFGLLVLKRLESTTLAWIYAALGAYCGAFLFIANHPVFFVFAYSPWILLSAMELLDPRSERDVGWGVIWLAANFACFNGGHLEVAVDLIAGLNLAALADALARQRVTGHDLIFWGGVGSLGFEEERLNMKKYLITLLASTGIISPSGDGAARLPTARQGIGLGRSLRQWRVRAGSVTLPSRPAPFPAVCGQMQTGAAPKMTNRTRHQYRG